MYQPERYRILIPETVPTYDLGGSRHSTVLYHYPCEVVERRDYRNDALLSETTAIRRELSQIKNEINDIKYRPASAVYYTVKEDHPYVVCSICNTALYQDEQRQYSNVPLYYCEQCHSFVEKPEYTVKTRLRSKTPTTTYQDSYRRPPPYSSPHGHLARRITLNELQTEPPPNVVPVQHPRHWIPTASKNSYPHRRWNLSVPHSEP